MSIKKLFKRKAFLIGLTFLFINGLSVYGYWVNEIKTDCNIQLSRGVTLWITIEGSEHSTVTGAAVNYIITSTENLDDYDDETVNNNGYFDGAVNLDNNDDETDDNSGYFDDDKDADNN